MFTDILKNALDVFRVRCTCEVWENALVFGVRVHGEEECTNKVLRRFRIMVFCWCAVELEL